MQIVNNDEDRIVNIENRLTKVEEYIKYCKNKKEEEWKENLKMKLDEIGGTVKSIGDRQKRTQWQWFFYFGCLSYGCWIKYGN